LLVVVVVGIQTTALARDNEDGSSRKCLIDALQLKVTSVERERPSIQTTTERGSGVEKTRALDNNIRSILIRIHSIGFIRRRRPCLQ